MNEYTYTLIKRRDETGEKRVALQMTDEEFDRIVEKYAQGKMTFQKNTDFFERLEKARAKTKDELKLEKFECVDTEGFEKSVILLANWTDTILREMRKEKNFRIEIAYDTEELKTDFRIYTDAKKSESNDTPQEY